MSEATGGSVKVELAGTTLRVDARPSRLVSLLRGPAGGAIWTTQARSGASHTEAVPAEARQVAFVVDGGLAVEASAASDFVALSEPSGRQVVVSFAGEVTVLPTGDGGDRIALGAHEALLVPGAGSEPRVVASGSLADADHDEISAAMEAAALALAMPSGETPGESPGESSADAAAGAAPAVAPPDPDPAQGAGPAKKGAAATPTGASAAKGTKTPKRGRPQARPPTKKTPAPAAATGARKPSGAGGATRPPGKGRTGPSGRPGAGPGDRRFIVGAGALAVVIALALGAFALSSDDSDEDDQTAGTTTTTAVEATTTTVEPATTTTQPATTSAAPVAAPTTIASPTTATPTTTTPPAAPVNYAIEPKSCQQNTDNSITYVATIENKSTVAFAYTIRVAFKDGDTTVASALASVRRLEPRRATEFAATGAPNRSLVSGGQCVVEEVDARPSGS